ncbi:MAG TPA: flagellar hook-basal body complex protein FliE [Verrucomicrobiales bacterium]|nr:flagellar hook-basal body complex protein FliE [Verrucomicrobiales bacterium]
MNPLSLIGRLSPQQMQPMPLPERLDAAKAIPLSELEKLSAGQATSAQPGSFDSFLGRFVNEVNDRQVNAASTAREMMAGGDVSLHQAMLAMEEASVSFQLMVQVRNKLLESYQEIMRMQL